MLNTVCRIGLFLILVISLVTATASVRAADAAVSHEQLRAQVAAKLQHAHQPGQLLVRFKSFTDHGIKQAAHRKAKATRVVKSFRYVKDLQLVEVTEHGLEAALLSYGADPDVVYAEPDYVVHASALPNDVDFDRLWGMLNTGQSVGGTPGVVGADARVASAWDVWTGDPDFKIAVIDSGVNYLHPDLAQNIWTNPNEIPDNGIDDDGNDLIDDIHGYDFFHGNGDPMDDNRHGSHVAGTIGAVGNNGIGVAGVNWSCSIVALKFLGASGSGGTSGAVAAMEYVIAHDIKVSNNSWGGGGPSDAMRDVIQASQSIGHLFIAAAGNDGTNNDDFPHFPSNYDLPNIISVASTTNTDGISGFSNFGPATVDIGAPGSLIYSTQLGTGYTFLSGTSMATPHVTGVVALLESRLPDMPWENVKSRILDTARPVPSLQGLIVAGGVINAASAVGDCNNNGIPDDQEINMGDAQDCNGNGAPDECDIADGGHPDCNDNAIPDVCDLGNGTSIDTLPPEGDGVPDECQTVRTVPSVEYPTIQAALDASIDHDFIIVSDGVHRGPGNRDLDPGGKKLTIRSENGPENCVIDAESLGRGFFLHSGETQDTLIQGFTITNGAATSGAGIGCFSASSPTIADCVLVGNVATAPQLIGGGISCDRQSSPSIVNTMIAANGANAGAGIACTKDSNPDMVNTTIMGNVATSFGGAIVAATGSHPKLLNCSVVANESGQLGGSVDCVLASLTIVNSIFWDNVAPEGNEFYMGGADGLPSTIQVEFSNVEGGPAAASLDAFSTIQWGQENLGENPPADDPLFAASSSGTWSASPIQVPDAGQTTFIDETAFWQQGTLVGKLLNPNSLQGLKFPVIANSATSITVRGNASLGQAGSEYVILDVHLTPDSPSVNTGDTSSILNDTLDLDRESRIFGGGVDMGSDELVPRIVSTSPPNGSTDARQPSNLDGSEPQGWDRLDVTFDFLTADLMVTLEDFSISAPFGGLADTTIESVQPLPPENSTTVRVTFTQALSPSSSVCVDFEPGRRSTCLSYLPGDVNADDTTNASDVVALIQELETGGEGAPVWSVDMDRDEILTPVDLLRLIDLQNGAGAFDLWFGHTLSD